MTHESETSQTLAPLPFPISGQADVRAKDHQDELATVHQHGSLVQRLNPLFLLLGTFFYSMPLMVFDHFDDWLVYQHAAVRAARRAVVLRVRPHQHHGQLDFVSHRDCLPGARDRIAGLVGVGQFGRYSAC